MNRMFRHLATEDVRLTEEQRAQIPDGETRYLGPFATAGYASLTGAIISDRVLTVDVLQGPRGDIDEGVPTGPWVSVHNFETSGDTDEGEQDELDVYLRHAYVCLRVKNESGEATEEFLAALRLSTAASSGGA